MSFETLKAAILKEATANAAATHARFAKQLSREEQRLKAEVRQIEEDIITQAEKKAEREVKRIHQEHQLQAKARVLEAKQEELLRTRDLVAQEILGWSDADTKQLLKSLLALAPNDGVVIAGSGHRDLLKELLKGTKLTLSDDTVADDGGCIVRSRETEINLTIRQLVAQLFTRHRAELAGRLFS